jgi:hypothetical protein
MTNAAGLAEPVHQLEAGWRLPAISATCEN